MKVKTSELTGAALDWAVAVALGFNPQYSNNVGGLSIAEPYSREDKHAWQPSIDWTQGGPLLDKYDVFFDRDVGGQVGVDNCITARCGIPHPDWSCSRGTSRLEAGMKAIAKHVLGEFVDIPDSLL